MLKEQTSATNLDDCTEFFVVEPLDVRAIIQECSDLPPEVRSAGLTRIDQRVLDKRLLSFLLSASSAQKNDAAWRARQKCRKESLSPCLGKVLICVFVQLPGIHYTIEIDPEQECVVHWECQMK